MTTPLALAGKENQLIESIKHKYIYDTATTSLLQIKNFSDIRNKIIPFFNKYPILGVKSLDFNDFKLVANLIDNKEHLTNEGFYQIIEIVKGMNLDRNFDNTIPVPVPAGMEWVENKI